MEFYKTDVRKKIPLNLCALHKVISNLNKIMWMNSSKLIISDFIMISFYQPKIPLDNCKHKWQRYDYKYRIPYYHILRCVRWWFVFIFFYSLRFQSPLEYLYVWIQTKGNTPKTVNNWYHYYYLFARLIINWQNIANI